MSVLREWVWHTDNRNAAVWAACLGVCSALGAAFCSTWSEPSWFAVVTWATIASFFSYRVGRRDEREVGA